jgi:GNAT superfamily N-acetyltransferase
MTMQRIDTTWAAFFGLPPPVFLLPGIQVVAHHQLADYQGVWLFRHHASLCLSVPPDSVEGVQAAVGAHTMESLFSEAAIRALLGPRIEQIIGPAYQGYVERLQFRSVSHPRVRALSRADQAALQQLADACEVDAWEHAGIAFDEPHVFGCFVADHMVAAARYRPAWGEAATIGVVTHPAYRGHGYGRAVVSAATGQGLEAGFIVLYQTLLANAPSVALATGLGYQPYATHLAVRLTSGGRAGA